jgi:hypothetical protein
VDFACATVKKSDAELGAILFTKPGSSADIDATPLNYKIPMAGETPHHAEEIYRSAE